MPKYKEIFSSEQWRRYWIGKAPSTRNAVEHYILNVTNITQYKVAKKYKIKKATISLHLTKLRKRGIIPTANFGRNK